MQTMPSTKSAGGIALPIHVKRLNSDVRRLFSLKCFHESHTLVLPAIEIAYGGLSTNVAADWLQWHLHGELPDGHLMLSVGNKVSEPAESSSAPVDDQTMENRRHALAAAARMQAGATTTIGLKGVFDDCMDLLTHGKYVVPVNNS